MNIRLERPEDWHEVECITREAFWNVYRPGCTEHYVLNQYRDNPAFVPELDFVMEEAGRIVGHVMFSKAEIILDEGGVSFPSWTFGPISIRPDCQRRGYGLKLLRHALEQARNMEVGLICMEGNIDFYRHAGFDLASKLKIHYHDEPADAEVPYFLAQELIPGYWGSREGTYYPPKGYFVADENPTAFAAYDAAFPNKVRAFNAGQLPPFAEKTRLVMQTERLTLRPWMDTDVLALYKYASDPEVGPRAGWAPHTCEEESQQIIRTFFNNDHTWAIVPKGEDSPIGCIGYFVHGESNIEIGENDVEAGYWVARPFWNNGICTEALRRLIDYCFREKGYDNIWSDYFVKNLASGRVMEKCGFRDTGRVNCCSRLQVGAEQPVRVMKLEKGQS